MFVLNSFFIRPYENGITLVSVSKSKSITTSNKSTITKNFIINNFFLIWNKLRNCVNNDIKNVLKVKMRKVSATGSWRGLRNMCGTHSKLKVAHVV